MSDAMKWAIERERELRRRSYREAMLWEQGVQDAIRLNGNIDEVVAFVCHDPEEMWIQTVREEMHSVRADLYEKEQR